MQKRKESELFGRGDFEVIRDLFTKWGPFLGCVGAGIGLFYEAGSSLRALRVDMERLRADCDARDAHRNASLIIGPGGYVDPTTRLGLETTLRDILKQLNRDIEVSNERWRDAFFQLNPTLQRPKQGNHEK